MKKSFLLLFILCFGASAQPVRAPRAQALIDDLLRLHPEIQTIGLHVTPPGLTENLNIACSKLGKVGKRSAEIDMQVIATGQPSSRMAQKAAFDIGVPLNDAADRKLGMIVVVIPAAHAKNEPDAMRQVLAIRDELQTKIASLDALFAGATVVPSPLTMVGQTPLPEWHGNFDRLGIDIAANRVYAGTPIEAFDLLGERQNIVWSNGPKLTQGAHSYEADATGKLHVRDATSGKELATLDGVGTPGDISVAGNRIFLTGSEGIVIYRDNKLVARFNTMGGNRSLYVPEKHLLYIVHPKNPEDGAGLQVYQVKESDAKP